MLGKIFAGTMALALPMLARAAVNDVFPGDYVALPHGTSTATLYLYHREFDGLYSKGQKLVPGTMQSEIAALRWVHVTTVGGIKIAPVAVVPVSVSHVADEPLRTVLGAQASGMGDIRLGAAMWLIDRPESGNYLGISGLGILPTGDYQSGQFLNIGENRWKATLNLGWVTKPAAKWTVDISPEIAWYGSNVDYSGGRSLDQKSSWAITSYLRHHLRADLQLFAGAQVNGGGETLVNQVAQNNEARNSRLYLGATWFPAQRTQIIGRYGRDTATQNGLLNNHEFSLRLLWAH